MELDPTIENILEKVKDLEIQNGIKDNQIKQYQELVDRLETQNWKLAEKCEKQSELLKNYRELCAMYKDAVDLLGGWGTVNGKKA